VTFEKLTDDLAREWDELSEDANASLWARPGWIQPWWRAFGKGDLEVFTFRERGRLRAAIPMGRSPTMARSPSNWHTPTFGAVASDEPSRRRLMSALLSTKTPAFTLMFVEENSPDQTALTLAAAARHRRLLIRELESSPVVSLSDGWDSYEAGLSKKIRTELRRRRRRLSEMGELEFAVEDGSRALDRALEEGFEVERAGWKGQKGTAIASSEKTKSFYTDVARWAASRGWLTLGYLRLDGKALAFDFCIEHDGSHFLLKTGFDPVFNKYGPGMLLRYEMIKRAFLEKDLHSYEFLGRNEAWKMQWTDQVRRRLAVQVFARVTGFGHWAAYRYGRPLAKKLIEKVRR
jgi:CelD/BcsL family acetyltransferase involved in cellulose biosynthesis